MDTQTDSYTVTISDTDPNRVANVYALSDFYAVSNTYCFRDPERDCDSDSDFDAGGHAE